MTTCTACGSRAPLCDECLESWLGHLRGTARARGMAWAQHVATTIPPPSRPWPAFEGRAAAIATRKVTDIAAGDERLLAALARECWADAARWWERQRT